MVYRPLLTTDKNTVSSFTRFIANCTCQPFSGSPPSIEVVALRHTSGGSRATLTLHLPLTSDSSDSWLTTICHDHVPGIILPFFGTCPWLNCNSLESPNSQIQSLWRRRQPSGSSDGSHRLRNWKAHHIW